MMRRDGGFLSPWSARLFIRKHTSYFSNRVPKGRNRSALCFYSKTQPVSQINTSDIDQHIGQSPASLKEQLQHFREKGKQAAEYDSFDVVANAPRQQKKQDAKRQGMPHFLKNIGFAVQLNVVRDEQIRKIRDQANIEVYILGEQQGLKIIIVGGQQDA